MTPPNPYESLREPADLLTREAPLGCVPLAAIGGAIVWIMLLFMFIPAISFSRTDPPPPGTFLWIKLSTTPVSLLAIVVLLALPRGRWWYVAAVLAGLLAFIQGSVWLRLP